MVIKSEASNEQRVDWAARRAVDERRCNEAPAVAWPGRH